MAIEALLAGEYSEVGRLCFLAVWLRWRDGGVDGWVVYVICVY